MGNIETYGMSIDKDRAATLNMLCEHYNVTIPELLESIFNLGTQLMVETMSKIPRVESEKVWMDIDFKASW